MDEVDPAVHVHVAVPPPPDGNAAGPPVGDVAGAGAVAPAGAAPAPPAWRESAPVTAPQAGHAPDPLPAAYRQVRYSPPSEATEIVLVRHGETIAAVVGERFPLLDGHGDPELGDEGKRQAEQVAERLVSDGKPIDAIYVTTLRRTAETAAPLAARLAIEPIVEPGLREVRLGDWEGGSYRQHVIEQHPLAVEMIERERWDVIPGAETNEELAERVREGIERIAAAHRGGRVVAFAHGGSIGMVLCLASGSRPFAFVGSDNGAISNVVVAGEKWYVRGFNDNLHLG